MKAKVKATGKIVDGIPIYYGSEGKGYLDVPVDHDIFDRYDLEEVELLEQPPLPDGLEEAAEKYRRNSCNAALRPNVDGPTPEYGGSIKGAFIAGAEWQKDKMIEEAAECMVMDFSSNLPRPQVDILLDPGKYHTGDKVKVIVIKEEQK